MNVKWKQSAASLLFFILTQSISLVHAADVLIGNSKNKEQTFSFPIGVSTIGKIQQNGMFGNSVASERYFYIGAADQTAGEFSLARVSSMGNTFESLTPEEVTLNGKKKQKNPLFNSQVHFLVVVDNHLVVVNQDQNKIHFIEDTRPNNGAVLVSQNIKDAKGEIAGGIVGLTIIGQDFVAAAVRSSQSTLFGEDGSGIALLKPGSETKIGSRYPQKIIRQFNAQKGSKDYPCAAPLNKSSVVLKMGKNLSWMGDVVDLHVDEITWSLPKGNLQWDRRLYLALQTTSADDKNSGTRALAVATYTIDGQLIVRPIAPDCVFDGAGDKIVGAKGAQQSVCIHKVKTMRTTSDISSPTYLIVLGGNGTNKETKRTVFALPIVYDARRHEGQNEYTINHTVHGTLADVTQDSRVFIKPATKPEHLFTQESRQARVGAGALPAGNIVDIYVRGSAVFVVVESADEGYEPGVFSSQALFDDRQMITGWMQWQRVAGVDAPIVGATSVSQRDHTLYFYNTEHGSIVKKTQWGQGASDGMQHLISTLNELFPQDAGGVQGLFDFSPKTPTLCGMSVLVATGGNTVVVAQTGQVVGKSIRACKNDIQCITFSGGVLDDLSSIDAAEIVGDGKSDGYLFVGGTCGLAVLTNKNGRGWTKQLIPHLQQLEDGMSFKKIGDYKRVCKITSDGTFVYVLTDKRLDKIDITKSNFETGDLSRVTLATVDDMSSFERYDRFFDCLVSEKVLLLATSDGVFRIGDGKQASTVKNMQDACWEKIEFCKETQSIIKFGPTSIIKLIPISVTGRAQDVSRCGGGMIYALDGNYTRRSSNIFRIMIGDTSASPVDETTIAPCPSLRGRLGSYRTCFATNGGVSLSSCNKQLERPAMLVESYGLGSKSIPFGVDKPAHISSIICESASGRWLVAGDFGVRINS